MVNIMTKIGKAIVILFFVGLFSMIAASLLIKTEELFSVSVLLYVLAGLCLLTIIVIWLIIEEKENQ